MEDTIKIRKDKIKNVAIVFLSGMLVLTFFSNSILNRALPEVATAYVQYNTITEKVRGNGMVTADDPYKVVVKDTRTIESVAVKVGDEVTKDQVLFYLEDAESEELKAKEQEVEAKEDEIDAKKEELDDAILSYTKDILSVDISNPSFHNIQNDNIASVTAYQAQIEASRQKVESAQKTVDDLNRKILVSSMDSDDDIDRETKIAVATVNRDNASKKMGAAEQKVADAQAVVDALGESEPAKTLVEAEATFITNKETYDTKKNELLTALITALGSESSSFVEGDYFIVEEGLPKGEDAIDTLRAFVNRYNDENNKLNEKFEFFETAYEEYASAESAQKEASDNLTNYNNNAVNSLNAAKTELQNATNEYNSYQAQIDSLTKQNAESAGDSAEYQNDLKVSLADAEAKLAAAKKEQDQLLKDISSELALSDQNDSINKIEKELAELREELAEINDEYAEIQASLIDATVVAPVEGTIISINKTAGESTVPQEAVATIQVVGKGMSLSFSVTNAQAAKVKVGDKAELQNAWYYNDVMITLNKIKPNPEDPGKKKLLEFTVEGLVQNGENLSVSVGERSAEYEHVVPNSAVREDNKGKFILIIDEKTTPFGNRYKARRVDVEVLASDEINTAVAADLQGYEYVITTSNQPVKAGDQVRLNG